MRLANGSAHLGYCTNIHPGERWQDLRPTLERYLPAVKARVSPDAAMGVGLRLSAAACQELSDPQALRSFQDFLRAHDLYVFTLNGFPYGTFHGTSVKTSVYQPDWRTEERLNYTNQLADVLGALLESVDGPGSISTVPVGFASDIRASDDLDRVAKNLMRHAAHLHRLLERTGRKVALALEPEPHCYLETTSEALSFFRDTLFDARWVNRFAELAGLSRGDAATRLPDYLGLCIDTCHAAVEFESVDILFESLEDADIRAHKIQLSAGLRIEGVTEARRDALKTFDDPVYLHQVVACRDGELERYLDLPDALASWQPRDAEAEWRVHFHVPIFSSAFEHFGSTQSFLQQTLARQAEVAMTPHLEVETYTWDVLPMALRGLELEDSIARELTWVRERL